MELNEVMQEFAKLQKRGEELSKVFNQLIVDKTDGILSTCSYMVQPPQLYHNRGTKEQVLEYINAISDNGVEEEREHTDDIIYYFKINSLWCTILVYKESNADGTNA